MSRAVWVVEERSPDKGRTWAPSAQSRAYASRENAVEFAVRLSSRYSGIQWRFRAVRYVPAEKAKKRRKRG